MTGKPIRSGKPSQEEIRAEVRRVLESRTFHGRDTLLRLFNYLAERTLDGSAVDLKEYTIGVELFGKPQDYDPQRDAYVRTVMGRLRSMLEKYYDHEGENSPVVIRCPRRQFALDFQARQPGEVEANGIRSLLRARLLLAAVVGLLIGVAGGGLMLRPDGSLPAVDGDLEVLWHDFLRGNPTILVSFGTLPFYRYKGGSLLRVPRLDQLSPAERTTPVDQLSRLSEILGGPPVEWNTYTGVGETMGAFCLGKMFARWNTDVRITTSRALSWDDITADAVIFLGQSKINPQLRRLPTTLAFRSTGSEIINLHPREGEPKVFRNDEISWKQHPSFAYALLSWLPGLQGKWPIVVLEGGPSPSIWGAVEFVTNPLYAKILCDHLRRPDGTMPQYFQVIIRLQIEQLVPIAATYVTHRELESNELK